MARLGDPQAKAAILKGLAAFTRDARTIAVAAAGRARLREARTILRGIFTLLPDGVSYENSVSARIKSVSFPVTLRTMALPVTRVMPSLPL